MKNLTKEIVKRIAENLIVENEITTTLEVKNKLRNMGYFALQDHISLILDAICYEENWDFYFNGRFRMYVFSEETADSIDNVFSSLN